MMRFVAGLERGFYLAHFSVAACPYATYYRDFFRAFFVEHALPHPWDRQNVGISRSVQTDWNKYVLFQTRDFLLVDVFANLLPKLRPKPLLLGRRIFSRFCSASTSVRCLTCRMPGIRN